MSSLANQRLDGLAKQIFPIVAKQFLGAGVCHHDLAASIGDNHGRWCGFDDGKRALLRSLKRILDHLASLNLAFQFSAFFLQICHHACHRLHA